MPRLRLTKTFRKAFQKKSGPKRAQLERAIDLLAENPRHPGLRVHRIKSAGGVWGARVSGGDRITFNWDEGQIVLRNNCSHDEALRRP